MKSENLADKKVISEVIKNHRKILHNPYSEKELFSKFKKIAKLIEGHKKLFIAIGNL